MKLISILLALFQLSFPLYVANICGGLCGKGYYLLLMKNGEGWKVQKEMLLWVS